MQEGTKRSDSNLPALLSQGTVRTRIKCCVARPVRIIYQSNTDSSHYALDIFKILLLKHWRYLRMSMLGQGRRKK